MPFGYLKYPGFIKHLSLNIIKQRTTTKKSPNPRSEFRNKE